MKRISALVFSLGLIFGIAAAADLYVGAVSPTDGSAGAATTTDDLRPVGSIGLLNRTAPANPASGSVAYYSDTDGNLHILESTGTDAELVRPDVATSFTVNVEAPVFHATTGFAGSGANITAINASNLASGTVDNARLDSNLVFDDEATSFTAAVEAPTIHATGMMVYGDSEVQTRARRVVTVSNNAADNPDRDTLQGAVDLINWYGDASATVPYVIQVQPGTYAEQSLELPDHVDLIGVDREACIIEMASTYYDGLTAPSTALLFVPYNSTVENLTISNLRTGGAGYGLAVVVAGRLDAGSGYSGSTVGDYYQFVRNCTIRSTSSFALMEWGDTYSTVENCEITGIRFPWVRYSKAARAKWARNCVARSTATSEGDETPLWVNGPGKLYFDNCRFACASTLQGAIYVDEDSTDGLDLIFNGCFFTDGTGENQPGNVVGAAKAGAVNITLRLNGCSYAAINTVDADVTIAGENQGDNNQTFGGAVTVTGEFSAAAATLTTAAGIVYLGPQAGPAARWNPATDMIEFDDGGGGFDAGIMHDDGEPDRLFTPDEFDMGALLVGGVNRIASTGAATVTTLSASAQPGAELALSGNTTVSASPFTIPWGTETRDIGGCHEGVTNPERITVPAGQGGVWTVTGSIRYPQTNAILTIYANRSSTAVEVARASSNGYYLSASWVGYLAAGDYVYLSVAGTTGSDILTASVNTFCAYKMH